MCLNLNINFYYNKSNFVIYYLDIFISIQMHQLNLSQNNPIWISLILG